MIIIACVLLYMGIGKKFEPLLLVPIAFGMLLANLPLTGLLNAPVDGSSPVCCGCSIRASSMRFIRPSSSSTSVP
ncbi:MAG: sodium ion-translocating decarboxylase subunit beta [Butyricicoccus sp.]